MADKIGASDKVRIRMIPARKPGEDLALKGMVTARLFDQEGRLIEERHEIANLIVDTGRIGIADQLLGTPTIAKPGYYGIGTGTTAPTANDTELEEETGTRAAISASRQDNLVTFSGEFEAGNGTGPITEAGIFSANTEGVMYSRITFNVINKAANDTLELTWTYTIGA